MELCRVLCGLFGCKLERKIIQNETGWLDFNAFIHHLQMKEIETETDQLIEALRHIYQPAAILCHLNPFTVYQIKIAHFESLFLILPSHAVNIML